MTVPSYVSVMLVPFSIFGAVDEECRGLVMLQRTAHVQSYPFDIELRGYCICELPREAAACESPSQDMARRIFDVWWSMV